jgi:hypothetical protein
MLVDPIQISGWVNGNLYTPTTEVLGILPIPDTVRISSGMAMYVPVREKTRSTSFLPKCKAPASQSYQSTPQQKNNFFTNS